MMIIFISIHFRCYAAHRDRFSYVISAIRPLARAAVRPVLYLVSMNQSGRWLLGAYCILYFTVEDVFIWLHFMADTKCSSSSTLQILKYTLKH